MKKISLDPEALVVDSFALEPDVGAPGTVNAYATTLEPTCVGPTCRITRFGCTCDVTCGCAA
jgi:hypothetical protein